VCGGASAAQEIIEAMATAMAADIVVTERSVAALAAIALDAALALPADESGLPPVTTRDQWERVEPDLTKWSQFHFLFRFVGKDKT
jgi:hypothetical protein